MATVDDLDAKAFEVLEAIYESGGEANTSEIKEYTGIEKNAIIHYRYDRLEEAGLVTTRTGETEGSRVPPKVAELTEEGRERIASGLFDTEDLTIVERMDRLERQFRAVVDEYRDVEQEFRNWRYDEETDEEVDLGDLRDEMESLREEQQRTREKFGEIDWEVVEQTNWGKMPRMVHLKDGILDLRQRVDELEGDDGHGQFDEFDVEQLRSSVARAEAEAEAAREENDDLRDEVQSLRSTVSGLNQRLDTMGKQMQNQQEEASGGLLSRFR